MDVYVCMHGMCLCEVKRDVLLVAVIFVALTYALKISNTGFDLLNILLIFPFPLKFDSLYISFCIYFHVSTIYPG